LDNEFWKPGWVKCPKEEFIKRQQEIINDEKWIIDGAYNSTLEMRFAATD
jgi:adenylate kinase family enzyme